MNSLSGTKTHSETCEFVYTNLHDVSGTFEFVHVNLYLSYELVQVIWTCEFVHVNLYLSYELVQVNSYSAGAIPYFWLRLPLFAVGAEKVAKMLLLLSG